MKNLLLQLIRIYQQFLSPLTGPSCRFYPSCSHYAVESIKHNGAILGSFQSIKRVLRCHPFSEGGIDMPPKRSPS